MRSCSGTAFAVMVVTALAVTPAAHASDERHGTKVGSVALVDRKALPDPEGPPPPAAQPKADPLSNGIGIGAVVGAGAGLGLVGWWYAHCDDTCDAPEPGGMYAWGAGAGAAIGAAVGLIVDAARKNSNRRVSVAAAAVPKRAAVRVSVRW